MSDKSVTHKVTIRYAVQKPNGDVDSSYTYDTESEAMVRARILAGIAEDEMGVPAEWYLDTSKLVKQVTVLVTSPWVAMTEPTSATEILRLAYAKATEEL